MTFEDQDPGDETKRYGHYIYVDAAEDLYSGEAVTINGDGEAERTADGGSDSVDGIAYINASAGDEVTIKTNGPVIAAYDGTAGVGDTVGSNDGTAGVGAGELGAAGDEYVILEAGTKTNPRSDSNDDYALVAQRP